MHPARTLHRRFSPLAARRFCAAASDDSDESPIAALRRKKGWASRSEDDLQERWKALDRQLSTRRPTKRGPGVKTGRTGTKKWEADYWLEAGMFDEADKTKPGEPAASKPAAEPAAAAPAPPAAAEPSAPAPPSHPHHHHHHPPPAPPPRVGTRRLGVVDVHAAGEPARVVLSGLPTIPGATMYEKRAYLMEHHDDLRTLLITEPRGYVFSPSSFFRDRSPVEMRTPVTGGLMMS